MKAIFLVIVVLLCGCQAPIPSAPDMSPMDKSTPTWDEFNMEAEATSISKSGLYRYAVTVRLTNASGRLYGANVPVEYEPDKVIFESFSRGSFVECQGGRGEPVEMFHDPDPCPNVVSVGTVIWHPSGGCLPYCRFRCDNPPANDMFTLYFVSVDADVGNTAKFKFACDGGANDCTFRARNCANGAEYFRLYVDGVEQVDYVENCEFTDTHFFPCEYDEPRWKSEKEVAR